MGSAIFIMIFCGGLLCFFSGLLGWGLCAYYEETSDKVLPIIIAIVGIIIISALMVYVLYESYTTARDSGLVNNINSISAEIESLYFEDGEIKRIIWRNR